MKINSLTLERAATVLALFFIITAVLRIIGFLSSLFIEDVEYTEEVNSLLYVGMSISLLLLVDISKRQRGAK